MRNEYRFEKQSQEYRYEPVTETSKYESRNDVKTESKLDRSDNKTDFKVETFGSNKLKSSYSSQNLGASLSTKPTQYLSTLGDQTNKEESWAEKSPARLSEKLTRKRVNIPFLRAFITNGMLESSSMMNSRKFLMQFVVASISLRP